MIVAKIVGLENVQLRLTKRIPLAARDRVAKVVRSLGLQLQRNVVGRKLAGQVLNRRTGTLARSINTRFEETSPDTFTSSTGTALAYGRFWELGFSGIQLVRAHVRRVKSRDVHRREATHDLLDRHNNRIGRGKRVQAATGIGFVREHARLVNQRARPFLKPALAEIVSDARSQLLAAIVGATV